LGGENFNIINSCSTDFGELGHDGGITPHAFIRAATGTEVPCYKSIIGTFMVYQDRLENIYCSYSRTQKMQNDFL